MNMLIIKKKTFYKILGVFFFIFITLCAFLVYVLIKEFS